MSAALFCSITMAVKRAALAAPVVAVASVVAAPMRSMSDGKSEDGTVSSAGDSFNKKQKAEEAKYFNKLQAEQLEKLKKKEAEKKQEK